MYLRIEKIEDKGVVCPCRPGPRAISNAAKREKDSTNNKEAASILSIHHPPCRFYSISITGGSRSEERCPGGHLNLAPNGSPPWHVPSTEKTIIACAQYRVDRSFRPNRIVKSFHKDCVWNTSFVCRDVDWFVKRVFLVKKMDAIIEKKFLLKLWLEKFRVLISAKNIDVSSICNYF